MDGSRVGRASATDQHGAGGSTRALKEGCEMTSSHQARKLVALNPEIKSVRAMEFEAGLRARVIGQDRSIRSITSLYQVFHAGMTNPTRPLGSMLFLGPTGSGKTHVVEA